MRNLKSLIFPASNASRSNAGWPACNASPARMTRGSVSGGHSDAGRNFKSDRGVALYLALLIMAILLSIGLALSFILIGQMKMIKGMGDSVIAFYAADTGMEKALVNRANPFSFSGALDNNATYDVSVPACSAENFCIQSVGTYEGVSRAIEVEY